jgi:hypothetical protein
MARFRREAWKTSGPLQGAAAGWPGTSGAGLPEGSYASQVRSLRQHQPYWNGGVQHRLLRFLNDAGSEEMW